MRKTNFIWYLLIISVLISVSLACAALAGDEPSAPPPPTSGAGEEISPAPTATTAPLSPTEPTAPEPTEPPAPEPTEPLPEPEDIDSDFPLPDEVQNFMKLDENSINFATSMSLEEVVEFYRGAFTGKGLVERQILTVIEESVVSMVFDGSPNGMAIVLQCVDLGDGITNVNLRYEDV